MTTTKNGILTSAPLTTSCVDCGKAKYQVGRSGECCQDSPRFDASQVNADTSPLFTPAMLAALLVDAEAAHKAWTDQLRAEGYAAIRRTMDIREREPVDTTFTGGRLAEMIRELHASIDAENKAWPQWYATFMAARLNQAANAARWTPAPTLDVPPFATITPTDVPTDVPTEGEIRIRARLDIENQTRVVLGDDETFAADESQDIAARRSVMLDSPSYANVPSGRIGTAGRNRYVVATDNDNANE